MIAQLVADLPEVYQPIYGHPELSAQVSRPCQDRLVEVLRVHDALRKLLARPLRVLDLGCAQGFFSLSLAEEGALVTGIDYLDKNIAVCQALAGEHPQLQVSFATGRVETVITELAADQYDLVLGLSVLHHLVHEQGADQVRGLLARAGELSGVVLVELALHEEPLYWGPSQPPDPRLLLAPLAFVHEIARHPTHLSSLLRPLLVASNRYWLLDGQAGGFETWSDGPTSAAVPAGQGGRRSFFSRDRVVTLYRFDQDQGGGSRLAFTRERGLLADPPAGFSNPTPLLSGENDREGWNVVEGLPGRLLQSEALVAEQQQHLQACQQQLQAMYASSSWRLTAPLRAVSPWLRRLAGAWRGSALKDRCRQLVRQTVIGLKRFFSVHPRLKAMALRGLIPFPALKDRLKRVGGQPPLVAPAADLDGPGPLSARARRMYRDLKAARERRRRQD